MNRMKSRIPILGLCLLNSAALLQANPRTAAEARIVAQSFMIEKLGIAPQDINLERVTIPLQNVSVVKKSPSKSSEEAPFYIFNNEKGHVIVSGSDLLNPILGYSLSAPYSSDMPEALSDWFNFIAAATEYVESHPEAAISAAQRAAAASTTSIAPLLGSIAWNQDEPFNNDCPEVNGKKSFTGCAATAMGQIAYFWRYPEHGFGTNSYMWNNTLLSVDFASQTYDYSKMFDAYNSKTCTEEQCAEVAKLCYHLGVSMNMSYSPTASGAMSHDTHYSAITNFGYNPNTALLFRAYYSFDEWNAKLLNELQNKRPIFFTGFADTGGHAFVLDGCDDKGYYHVNWGWGGYADNYYDVCILNPSATGIGASDSETGFCSQQAALFYLQPEPTDVFEAAIYANDMYCYTSSAKVGEKMKLQFAMLHNHSAITLNGEIGAAWVQNGEIVATSKVRNVTMAKVSTSYATATFNDFITIPSTLADGDYRIYGYYKDKASGCTTLIHTQAQRPDYVNVNISNGVQTLTAYPTLMKLEASNWNTDTSFKLGLTNVITVDVKNANDQTSVTNFVLKLTSPSGSTSLVKGNEILTLAPNETKTESFNVEFSQSGTWTAAVCYNWQNLELAATNTILDGDYSTKLNVEVDSTRSAIFNLASEPTMVEGTTIELNSDATFNVEIKNTGEWYIGKIQVQFFLKEASTTNPTLAIEDDLTVDAFSNKTIQVTGKITGLRTGTYYFAKIFYLKGDKFVQIKGDGLNSYIKIGIKKPSAIEAVKIDTPKTATAFNVLGQEIGSVNRNGDHWDLSSLPQGVYIIDGKKIINR